MAHSGQALLALAATLFELRPPVYEFALCVEEGLASDAEPRAPFEPDFRTDWAGAGADASEMDVVEDLGRLPFPTAIARTVICVGALENLACPQRAAEEMLRILAPGGLLVVSAEVGTLPAEGPDADSVGQSVHEALCRLDASVVAWLGPEERPEAVFGVACKAPVPESFLLGVNSFLSRAEGCLGEASAELSWWKRAWAGVWRGRWRGGAPGSVRFTLDLPARRSARPSRKTTFPSSQTGSYRDGQSPIVDTDPF